MKENKGAVLTGVILMVLVMTLIAVPLLGMVVYKVLKQAKKRKNIKNASQIKKGVK